MTTAPVASHVRKLVAAATFAAAASRAFASPADDEKAVAALDIAYQAAVERNDADTMARILADDFILVNGRGRVHTKHDLLESARKKSVVYELQVEEPGTQKVRLWGDTAVVTALLRIKGLSDGQPLDVRLWFSDTYVRTPVGWKYAFGQSSIPLPKEELKIN
jgi:ketosteroid isomerase-like protein